MTFNSLMPSLGNDPHFESGPTVTFEIHPTSRAHHCAYDLRPIDENPHRSDEELESFAAKNYVMAARVRHRFVRTHRKGRRARGSALRESGGSFLTRPKLSPLMLVPDRVARTRSAFAFLGSEEVGRDGGTKYVAL